MHVSIVEYLNIYKRIINTLSYATEFIIVNVIRPNLLTHIELFLKIITSFIHIKLTVLVTNIDRLLFFDLQGTRVRV